MKVTGFVDLQVNGYRGVDFSAPKLTEADFVQTCEAVLGSGTAAFVATVVTCSAESYRRNLPIMARAIKAERLKGRVLGIHLEGPFISAEDGARGAHNRQWVRRPDVEYFKQLVDLAEGTVRLITVAAELEGAEEVARCAVENGISVSLGHQLAGQADIERLVGAGARALTHLGNGVPLQISRHENPIFAGLANEELSAMIITDGHHLPPAVIKTFIRTKGAARCIVTSDTTALGGMEPGEYEMFGGRVVLDETGRIYNPDTGYLGGSSATMVDCMNYLTSLDLLSDEELAAVGYYNPLRLIGLSEGEVAGGGPAK